MKAFERISKKHVLSLILCAVLPLIMIGFGILGLIKGGLFATGGYMITRFWTPILCFLLSALLTVLRPFRGSRILGAVLFLIFLFFLDFSLIGVKDWICAVIFIVLFLGFGALLIFWKSDKGIKTLLVVLSQLIFVEATFVMVPLFGYSRLKCDRDGEIGAKYEAVLANFDQMPSLDAIGTPEALEHCRFDMDSFLYVVDSDALICRYDGSGYAEQKALLEERYRFQAESIRGRYDNCDVSAEIDGYVFRLLSLDAYEDLDYPKRLMLIATNDETREIVYLSYYDNELDHIGSLERFIRKDCGWEHMR